MLQQTNLPNDIPERVVQIPTMNRWAQSLPNLLLSIKQSVGNDADRYTIILADGTPRSETAQILRREALFDKLPLPFRKSVFILDRLTQERVVEAVEKATKIRRDIVEACLSWTGYGSQRAKLDVVTRAFAEQKSIKALTLDDDVIVPQKGVILDPSKVSPGMSQMENSQTIVQHTPPSSAFTKVNNSIESFFSSLGRRVDPDMVASDQLRDTMHGALETAQRSGKPTQFEVAHDPHTEITPTGRIIATAATKYGIPDYRTIKIAEANLRGNFPSSEVEFESFLSGPTKPFLFRTATTNVDSACIARLLDRRTAQIGWWLVTNTEISKSNPLQTVTTSYRADNELLPGLLGKVKRVDDSLWYQGGLDVHILHQRERTGARPDIIEQATASLIGNVVAQAVLKNLSVDRTTLRTRLQPTDHYSVPEELAHSVYLQLKILADIALDKMNGLSTMLTSQGLASNVREVATLHKRFESVYTTIQSKTANFNFPEFYRHTNEEVRAQLDFYREVLDAAPRIGEAVSKLVQNGQYPVLGEKAVARRGKK
jgi:hypothetical protein